MPIFTAIEASVPEEDQALFHYYHAQAAFGTGQFDRYLALLREAIRLDPDAYQSSLVEAYLRVADQHNQGGELAKYIEFLELAVGESPRAASLHLKLGNAYDEAHEGAKARDQWRMVLDLEPDHPQRIELLNRLEKSRRGGTPSR